MNVTNGKNGKFTISWLQILLTLTTMLISFAFAYGIMQNKMCYHDTEIQDLRKTVRNLENSYVDREALRQATQDMKTHFDEKLTAYQEVLKISLKRIEDKIEDKP